MATERKDYYGNEVLYRMCAEQPLHVDVNVVASKLWLIGRSYAAAIERGAGKYIVAGDDFCFKQAGPKIVEHKQVDEWLATVSKIDKLTNENIELSLACHKNLMDLFHEITDATKRSLASKYLHFHARNAFFIYDSVAHKRIKELVGEKYNKIGFKTGYDDEYAQFCAGCIYHRDELEKTSSVLITPRQLDMELLNYGF